MGLLLGALLALVPLLITPNLHLFFDVTPKVAVLLAGSSLALVLWIRDSRRGLISCRTYSRFYLLLLAALVWLVVATVLSTDRFLSITGTNWRRSGLPVHAALLVLAFTTANWLAGRQERVLPLLRVVSLAGLAASLYGILQYFGWDPWLPHVGYQAGEGEWTIVRPPSTLGHAGAFATWLLFPVFASIGLAYTEKGTVWRAIAVLSAAAGAMGIVVSGTRAALLALAAGGVLLAWWMRARVSRKLAAGALAAAVALAVFYYSPAGAMLRSRVHWIQEDVQGGARIWLFRDSLGMAGHRLILGYGPETFSKSFPRFESAELARAYPNFYHESPHNLFLDALLQTGIPGLAILLGLIALALLGGMRASRSNPLFKALCASLITCVISLQFTPAVPAIAFYCTFVAAILIAGPRLRRKRLPGFHRYGQPASPSLPSHWPRSPFASGLRMRCCGKLTRLSAGETSGGRRRSSAMLPTGAPTPRCGTPGGCSRRRRAQAIPPFAWPHGKPPWPLPSALRTGPRIRRTLSTTWRPSVPFKTMPVAPSSTSAPRSQLLPTGTRRTGCWRGCCKRPEG